jgi:hypothetical protein
MDSRKQQECILPLVTPEAIESGHGRTLSAF